MSERKGWNGEQQIRIANTSSRVRKANGHSLRVQRLLTVSKRARTPARAGPPLDICRVVFLRRHVQDRADVVYIVLRQCAHATRDQRLERDDQRAFLMIEDFGPDCCVDSPIPLFSPEN